MKRTRVHAVAETFKTRREKDRPGRIERDLFGIYFLGGMRKWGSTHLRVPFREKASNGALFAAAPNRQLSREKHSLNTTSQGAG